MGGHGPLLGKTLRVLRGQGFGVRLMTSDAPDGSLSEPLGPLPAEHDPTSLLSRGPSVAESTARAADVRGVALPHATGRATRRAPVGR